MKTSERYKVDSGLKPQALNNTNVTGAYFPRAKADLLLAFLAVGAMAATKTAILALYEAKDEDGTDAQALTGATATITANTKVNSLTMALSTVMAADTVTINGLVFTAHATVTTKASRQFSITGNDTADGDELAACINDPEYGVPGVKAVNSSGTITLTSEQPGEVTITASTSGSTVTIATVSACAAVEIKNEALSDGYTHVAAKVTTTANTVVGVTFVSGDCRFTPEQAWAASA